MTGRESGDQSVTFKVVLLGEGAVGKTSLVLRYVEDKFRDKHVSTLQASFLTKKLTVADKRVTLSLWDTAGQERFHALGPIYYRDSNGALLVYDITDEDSFKRVQVWVKELRKMLGDQVCLRIVGNKLDLEKDRHVPVDVAESFAQSVGAKHFQTSAKLNKGLEELFFDITKGMLQQHEERAKEGASRVRNTPTVTILDDQPPPPTTSSCC